MSIKYKDPNTGDFKDLKMIVGDNIPVGIEVDYDGQNVPTGWQEVEDSEVEYPLMKIKKVSQTTAMHAQVVDGYSESTADSYSCNHINKLNKYSTTEVDTGMKWIDGKPIYRKVFTGTMSNSLGTLILLLNNISYFQIVNSCITNRGYRPITYFLHTSGNTGAVDFVIDNDNLYYRTMDNNVAGLEYLFVIEYTKTTD